MPNIGVGRNLMHKNRSVGRNWELGEIFVSPNCSRCFFTHLFFS